MIVLYKGQPAVIKAVSTDKIEIATASETKRVRDKDISFIHEGPCDSAAALLAATVPPGDLEEAADFFEGDNTTFAAIAELVWGKLRPADVWAAWTAVSEHPRYQCSTPDASVSIRDAAEAAAIREKAGAKEREGAERDAFIKRISGKKCDPDCITAAADSRFLQEIEALALGKTDRSKLLKEAGKAESPEAAHRLLLETGYWSVWRNPWPHRHGVSVHSSQVPIESPPENTALLDLTAQTAWAIDNAWSTDPDDAVCVDDDKLWVHIADPAATVTPDSPGDLDARSRGSTLYLPEGASRMLNEQALEYYALGLSETSRALSFCISFTDSGAVEDVTIHRTRVRVSRLTYAEADVRRAESGLAPLFAIAERNIARRLAAGAVAIDLPEAHIHLQGAGTAEQAVLIEPNASSAAADMVREMMLLAGEACARFAFKHRIPFQYVSQEEPGIPAVLPEGLAGEYRKRRSMKSRRVGTTPADHAGLGLGMYSQVTSPLRRYGDLIAHQQLHRFLDGLPPMSSDEMLERIAQGDAGSRACTLSERESNLHWILVYLSLNPQWTAEAVVVEKNGTMATILIPSLAQESKLIVNDDVDLNAVLTVRAGNIDIASQTVKYIVV